MAVNYANINPAPGGYIAGGGIDIAGGVISAKTAVVTITATGVIPALVGFVLVNNGATNITLTMPDPLLFPGREIVFSRAPGSTGTISLTNVSAAQIQALNGTMVGATSIAANSAAGAGQHINFRAIGANWYRG